MRGSRAGRRRSAEFRRCASPGPCAGPACECGGIPSRGVPRPGDLGEGDRAGRRTEPRGSRKRAAHPVVEAHGQPPHHFPHPSQSGRIPLPLSGAAPGCGILLFFTARRRVIAVFSAGKGRTPGDFPAVPRCSVRRTPPPGNSAPAASQRADRGAAAPARRRRPLGSGPLRRGGTAAATVRGRARGSAARRAHRPKRSQLPISSQDPANRRYRRPCSLTLMPGSDSCDPHLYPVRSQEMDAVRV
jgi:hypothetical protein